MKTKYKGKITYRIKELLRNKLNFISRFIFKLLDDQSFTLHCINGLDYKYTRYQISLYLYTHIYVYMFRPIYFISYFILYDWKWKNGRLLVWMIENGWFFAAYFVRWNRPNKGKYLYLKTIHQNLYRPAKKHEWFIFVKISHLSVSNCLHKTFTTLTDMIVFRKIKFSTSAMYLQL